MCALALMCSASQHVSANRIAPGSEEYVEWMKQIKISWEALELDLQQAHYAEVLDLVDGIYEVRKTGYLKRRLEKLLDFYQSSAGIVLYLIDDEEPIKSEEKILLRCARKIGELRLAIDNLDSPKKPERCRKASVCSDKLLENLT